MLSEGTSMHAWDYTPRTASRCLLHLEVDRSSAVPYKHCACKGECPPACTLRRPASLDDIPDGVIQQIAPHVPFINRCAPLCTACTCNEYHPHL